MFEPNYFTTSTSQNLHQVIIHPSLLLCFQDKNRRDVSITVSLLSFSLEMIMDESICPSAVADKKTVMFFNSLRNKPHTPGFFWNTLYGTMLKNATVSFMLPARKNGYFPILMKHAASSQNLLRTPSGCFGSIWLIKVWAHRARLCWLKNFLTQPLLALNNRIWGCITSFAFSWRLITDTGKHKTF